MFSIEYWFRCMDLDGDGVLSMYELEYFYEEQCQKLEAMAIEPLSFEDCLCQMLDLVKPEVEGRNIFTNSEVHTSSSFVFPLCCHKRGKIQLTKNAELNTLISEILRSSLVYQMQKPGFRLQQIYKKNHIKQFRHRITSHLFNSSQILFI